MLAVVISPIITHFLIDFEEKKRPDQEQTDGGEGQEGNPIGVTQARARRDVIPHQW